MTADRQSGSRSAIGPLSLFAWMNLMGWRAEGRGRPDRDNIFGFLTTEPNAPVDAYQPKAMLVILTTPLECDVWLTATALIALELQRPLG